MSTVAFDERPPSGSPSPDPAPGTGVRDAMPVLRSEVSDSTDEFELPPLPVLRPFPDFARRPNGRPLAPAWPARSGEPSAATTPAPPVIPAEDGRHAAAPASPEPTGRSVLLLGATGSIGSAIARALAAAGDRVVLQHGAATAHAAELLASLPGTDHLLRSTDLADPAEIAELIASVDDVVGGLDVVINAAADRSPTATLDSGRNAWADSWASVLSVDVLGAAAVAHAAAAVFRARRRGGRIILVPARGRPVEGPADLARESAVAAVSALGRGLARELAPHGIGVTTVTSGPAAASGWSPDDLAATVVWLMAGPAISLPGAVLTIEG